MTRKSLAPLAALVVLATLTPALSRAQDACRPADRGMILRRNAISRIVTDSSHEFTRALMSLPAVADSAVVPVTDEVLCAKARDAYIAGIPPIVRASARAVYVIRVGSVYAVDDPAVKVGEMGIAMTLDATFALLSSHTQ